MTFSYHLIDFRTWLSFEKVFSYLRRDGTPLHIPTSRGGTQDFALSWVFYSTAGHILAPLITPILAEMTGSNETKSQFH